MSQVVTATRSARVESSPPEMPIFSGVSGGELLDPLGQPRALDAEDLGTSAVQLGALRRHERRARHVALQALHRRCQGEGDPSERPQRRQAIVETGHDAAVGPQPGDVDVPGDPVRLAADRLAVADPGRLGQQDAVLGDQAMAAEDHVGRRLGRAAARHRVGGDASARLADDQLGAIPALADRLVARRDVQQHRRPGHGLQRSSGAPGPRGPRRSRCPRRHPRSPPRPPCPGPRTADRSRTGRSGRPARSRPAPCRPPG